MVARLEQNNHQMQFLLKLLFQKILTKESLKCFNKRLINAHLDLQLAIHWQEANLRKELEFIILTIILRELVTKNLNAVKWQEMLLANECVNDLTSKLITIKIVKSNRNLNKAH